MIKAVLFDYGGTLVRERAPWSEAKGRALRRVYEFYRKNGASLSFQAYADLDESVFNKYLEVERAENRDVPDAVKYEEMVGKLFPQRSDAWHARVAKQANEEFWRVAVRNFELRRDARPTLAKLKSMKLRLAVVSNHHNPESLKGHLRNLRIDGYFSPILASAEIGIRKPDPRIMEKCLSLMKVRRDQAIFVGDSVEFDVEGARRAGIRSVRIADGVSSGDPPGVPGTEPDFTIRSLREIPAIVAGLDSRFSTNS